MRSLLFLAWRNLVHHRFRSTVLIAVLSIVASIPLLTNFVVGGAEKQLTQRAVSTPLVYGAIGSEVELVLGAAYFNGRSAGAIELSEYDAMLDLRSYDLLPIRVNNTVRGFPLVGTDHEYYRVRGLKAAEGDFPFRAGQVMLGATVAQSLELSPGDEVSTDITQAFDLAGAYPISLVVSGVLERSGTPDDRAVFADLRTAWIAEGFGHGHQELQQERDQKLLLSSSEDELVANASLKTYTRVTEENSGSFHYHGPEDSLPLSAVLVFPKSDKAAALLKGWVAEDSSRQIVNTERVVSNVLVRVFEMKAVLHKVVLAMAMAALSALALVVALSVRMRRREFEIANQIGASRRHAMSLVTVEMAVLMMIAMGVTFALSIVSDMVFEESLRNWIVLR